MVERSTWKCRKEPLEERQQKRRGNEPQPQASQPHQIKSYSFGQLIYYPRLVRFGGRGKDEVLQPEAKDPDIPQTRFSQSASAQKV